MNETDVRLKIDGFAFGGAAFGRLPNGKICFVRGCAPGETVLVHVTKEKKSFASAELTEILDPSPDRIEPECPLFVRPGSAGTACPGCSYQHVSYDLELQWKNRQLHDFLVRSGLTTEDTMQPPFPAPVRYGYRNRLRLACRKDADGAISAGYRGEDNKTLVPLKSCPLARKSINECLAKDLTAAPDVPSLQYRWTLADGAVSSGSELWKKGGCLTEQLGHSGAFRVSCKGFFQVNIAVATELAKRVVTEVKESGAEFLAELYCGVGVFSILCAEAQESLHTAGVELDAEAIACAQKNARFHGVHKRCSFRCGDAEKQFARLLGNHDPAKTAVLLDPPRTGLSSGLTAALASSGVQEILYISCAPDTLKRDLTVFRAAGWRIVSSGMLDMFPATSHFETLTILRRG